MSAVLVPPDVLAQAALLAGVCGLVLVAWGAPRRSSPAALALWLGFTSLAASGVLGMGAIPDLDAGWSAVLMFAALLGLGLAGGLAILEFRSRAKALLLAMSETETLRREVARLSGINVRVEDEMRDLRRQLQAGVGARSGQQALLEATVTHQRQALETATQALRRHRALFDGAVEGMAILERETLRLAEVNPALQRLTGRSAEELGQTALLDLFADGPLRPAKSDLQRAARESRPLDAAVGRKDGHAVPVEVTVAAVGEGDEARLLVVLRDATERRSAETDAERALGDTQDRVRRVEEALLGLEERNRHLEAANARLADLQERKDQHLASVAHELRTPLTSIRSFSEILLKHEEAEPEIRREFLGIVQRESERLTRLVNNVLDLARIEAGASKLTPSEFDARVLLTDSIAAVQGMANESKVTVRVEGLEAPLVLRADRDRAQQLLVNLLANAVKFSPEGGQVEVAVAGDGAGGPVRFEVRDHGRGIPTEQLPHIFERFHRVEDGSAPNRMGTGLGLAISREIVALHGGRIEVESQPGKGSTFRVEFPGLEEARDRTAARQAAAELPVPPPAPPVPVTAPVFATPPGPVVTTPKPAASGPPSTGRAKEPPSRPVPVRETPTGRTLPSRRALDLMSTTGTLPPIGG